MKREAKYRYKIGYCAAIVDASDFRKYIWIKEFASQCEQFILGIPNVDIVSDIYHGTLDYNVDEICEYWGNIRWVDSIVVIDREDLDYQNAYARFHFDACIYGSRYGLRFEEDKKFMIDKGVSFLSALPEKLEQRKENQALELPLKYYKISRKVILFGTGKYFDIYMERFGERFKPAYAIDNSNDKQGTQKAGIEIASPLKLKEEKTKEVLVIICSRNFLDMIEQLQEMGNFEYRLLINRNEIAQLENADLYITPEKANQETLKKIHDINYEMLKTFDSVCRKYGITYSLNYGTLLGALRHKGFIPWDNDIDIVMTRENYHRLEEKKDYFEEIYSFIQPETLGDKKYLDCVPRLNYKAAYIKMDQETCRYYYNRNNRIDLDIFLIDKTYDTWKGKLQRFELAVLYGMMNAYRHKSFFADYDKKMVMANNILCYLGRHISLPWLRKRVDKVARRFEGDDEAPYYFISNDALHKLTLLFPANIFSGTADVQFEGLKVEVASGYDEMCRIIYGDYMQLPPEGERVPHWGRILITADAFVFQEPVIQEG